MVSHRVFRVDVDLWLDIVVARHSLRNQRKTDYCCSDRSHYVIHRYKMYCRRYLYRTRRQFVLDGGGNRFVDVAALVGSSLSRRGLKRL